MKPQANSGQFNAATNRFTVQKPKPKISAEQKLFFFSLSSLIPTTGLIILLWSTLEYSVLSKLLISAACLLWIISVAYSIKNSFIYQIRTLNTLIEAVRNEDYSLRSAHSRESGDLAELYQQINSLTGQLQKSRQDEQEIKTLLEKIISQINVAIVVCDNLNNIVLINHLAAKLLDQKESALIGLPLENTALSEVIPQNSSHLIEFDFPGARGRWQISRQAYVQDGKQGSLIFITDLEQVLSEEEIKAWQSLIRVIAHEVNNSLTPIISLCQTLDTISRRDDQQSEENLQQGLGVINERALNLKKFISDYARIARLPDAVKTNFNLINLLQRIITIHSGENIVLEENLLNIVLFGDPSQIEQILINLVKNALEANIVSDLAVEIRISTNAQFCEIHILDHGEGIINTANLFVPFYTTKPKGAGIGLALCRRIANSHHGKVTLQNRTDSPGAIATLKLPLAPTHQT